MFYSTLIFTGYTGCIASCICIFCSSVNSVKDLILTSKPYTGNGEYTPEYAFPTVAIAYDTMVPKAGFEPATNGLTVRCSTD